MKYFLLLLSMFFIITACSDGTESSNACEKNSDCKDEKVCFYGGCFKEGDKAMGVKTVQIIGKANMDELVDGDLAGLNVQVVLSGTEEMKEAFTTEELRKIVGPISGEPIVFEITEDDVESTLSSEDAQTNEFGMGGIELNAKNSTNLKSVFNVIARTKDCNSPVAKCNKRFSVAVDKRSKSLSLVSNTEVNMFTNSSKLLMARVTTNGNSDVQSLPFANQDVTFKINGISNSSDLEVEIINDSGETVTQNGNELTIKTDYAGIARVRVNSAEEKANFTINVSSSSTVAKTFNINVLERNGGCFEQSDCEALGEAYQCQNQVCVFVPIPCQDDSTCPEGFECKDNPSGGNNKVCVEKPYVCGEDGLDIESCRCVTDLNCQEGLTCVRGRCVEQNIACTDNIDCPNGLICRNGTCQPNHTECKADLNCHAFFPDRCKTEGACLCREGLCVNPCPDTEYIELSGGSGANCTSDNSCADNEVCFTGHGVNKCISKWDANYYFHLIEALPPSLGNILSGIGGVLGPISEILVGNGGVDWGLPGWLSWLEDTIVAAVRPLIDRYIPSWAQNLIVGLNDTIKTLEEMKVKVRMSFVHDELVHSKVKGMEVWEAFYIEWNGSWTEVRPEGPNDNFQVNSSEFTGSVACELKDGNPIYSLYINEHSAEFYFGRFVMAFLNGVLIPAVTSNQYHSLGEAAAGYIDCVSISEAVADAVANIVGDFASGFINASTFEGLCNSGVNILVNRVEEYINQIHIGDAAGGSDAFKFAGFARIETRSTEATKLKDGTYTGTLNLGGERSFTADWDAKKAR